MTVIRKAANRHTVVATGWSYPEQAYDLTPEETGTDRASLSTAKNTTRSGDFGFPDFTASDIPDGATINSVKVNVSWGLSNDVTGGVIGCQPRVNNADSGSEITQTFFGSYVDGVTASATYGTVTLSDLRGAETSDLIEARLRATRGSTNSVMSGMLFAIDLEVDYTPVPSSTSVARVSLSSASTPTTRTEHYLHIRARTTSTYAVMPTMRVALYEGSTNRSGDLETQPLTTSLRSYALPISDANAANISSYSDLEVRFWGYSAVGFPATFEVDSVFLEAPAGTGGATEDDFTADAVLKKGQSSSFAANAVIKASSGTKTFTANAVIKAGSGTKTFTANAVLKKTILPTFTANAVLKAGSGTKTFTADAIVRRSSGTLTFTANSVIKRATSSSLAADAAIFRTILPTFSADAVIKAGSGTKTFTADAWFVSTFSGSFTADAVIKRAQPSSLAADSVIKRSQSGSFAANAVIKKTWATASLHSVVDAGYLGSSSASWSHPVGAATTAIALVTGRSQQWNDITAVTFGNKALSQVVATSGGGGTGSHIAIWLLTDISGRDDDIVRVSLSGYGNHWGGSVAFDNTSGLADSDLIAYSTISGEVKVSLTGPGIALAVGLETNGSSAPAIATSLANQQRVWSGEYTGYLWYRYYWKSDVKPAGATVDIGYYYSSSVVGGLVGVTLSGLAALAADAVIVSTQPSSFTANAVISAAAAGTFSADAVISAAATSSFSADAVQFATIAGSFTADAVIPGGGTVSGDFSADAVINSVSRCIWTTPGDTVNISTTETLAFLMPEAAAGDMHFQIEIDTADDYPSPTVWTSHSDLTGWEYWDGGAWQPVPQAGVSNTYCGNEARYTIQSPLSEGTYYRRVRAGVI